MTRWIISSLHLQVTMSLFTNHLRCTEPVSPPPKSGFRQDSIVENLESLDQPCFADLDISSDLRKLKLWLCPEDVGCGRLYKICSLGLGTPSLHQEGRGVGGVRQAHKNAHCLQVWSVNQLTRTKLIEKVKFCLKTSLGMLAMLFWQLREVGSSRICFLALDAPRLIKRVLKWELKGEWGIFNYVWIWRAY